jgi:hypothetical protein
MKEENIYEIGVIILLIGFIYLIAWIGGILDYL